MRNPISIFPVKISSVPRATPRREISSKANLPSLVKQTAIKHLSFRDLKTNSSVFRFSTKSRPDPKLLDFINAKNDIERIEALNKLINDDSQSDQRFFKPAKYQYDAAIEKLNLDVLSRVKQDKSFDISTQDLLYKPKR